MTKEKLNLPSKEELGRIISQTRSEFRGLIVKWLNYVIRPEILSAATRDISSVIVRYPDFAWREGERGFFTDDLFLKEVKRMLSPVYKVSKYPSTSDTVTDKLLISWG